MGTYQKLKQAEADIARLEREVDESAYWAHYAVTKDELESAKEKYRTLKYEYTIQSTLLISIVFTAVAVLTSYLLGGV